MENMPDNFYNFSREHFKDEKYDEVVKDFPEGGLVYIEASRQVGMITEVKVTADGPALRIAQIGLVPVAEARIATDDDIEKSRFKGDVKKVDNVYFFND